ncbi:uncharacterized protein LOC120070239 isoform X2 [Benincasa hispida]|uniref:uncharacterized protein LOC120070239 isoform X2 n=1 Tax=Benincasa hispida TaxID=102211 RepID=UPI00190251F4|nr:uncharacterized protein LOC120070239 isoform X2 [Benincasa hispida]
MKRFNSSSFVNHQLLIFAQRNLWIFPKRHSRQHSDEKRHIAIHEVLILKDKDLWRLLLLGTFIDTDIKDLENDGVISSLMELSDSGEDVLE